MNDENNSQRLPGITTIIQAAECHNVRLPSINTHANLAATALPRPPLAVTSINAILNAPQSPNSLPKPCYSPVKPVTAITRTLPPIAPNPLHNAPAASLKRKSLSFEDDLPNDIPPDDERLQNPDQNCDQIRRKINNLINSGDMKVGEFIKTIGVNSKSYGSFMRLSGPYKGSSNGTFYNAFAFFKRRELLGIKPAKKAKVSKEEETRLLDVSSVKLDGEETMEVPVYDTCDEIRRKITAFLREPGVTQAAFLREIAKSFPDGRNSPQSKVLKDFLAKKGARAGNTSAVFYGSYVFFEKMRIRDGKPKTQLREEMERIYAGGDSDAEEGPSRRSAKGLDIKRASSGKVWCMKGDRVREDKYGRLSYY
ncbi:hypothetical protein BP5796_09154 [Coleophoma crateriformis]|uniref:DUF7726 domain-containing protein n=1 Tax=Coleophoma crateriformis TaxID=565419 RepID=A0A3D8R393_9HELO|nr:hypothetical protein BP5796_09154 [Coleophoma crateriformis]